MSTKMARLAKLREQFDLPLIVLAFVVLVALERTEAFTLVEDELISYRQTSDTPMAIRMRFSPCPTFA